MIITRKIEIFVCEEDKDLRKSYYEKIYRNRDIAVKVANMGISHLFVLNNTMPYLSDEDKERIAFLGCKGEKSSKINAPYTAASKAFKGEGDMGMLSCLLKNVLGQYRSDLENGMWNRSLRSYKGNLPMPFKESRFSNMRFADYVDGEGNTRQGCFFTLIGIPFQMKFGADRSNNRAIVEGVLNGKYKMRTSSIKVIDEDAKGEGKKKGTKIFLLLSVDMPKKEVELKEGKKMYAFLGVFNPIVCTTEVNAKQAYDSGMKVFEIGTEEEFNHRRKQIQEAVKRCQINNRYSVGGKGRRRKCQAIERFHDKEKNYVETKLHTYSRKLVDLAVKHKCSEIVLMKQENREKKAKEDNQEGKPFVLRNWSYYGLKEKIKYKSEMVGMKFTVEK